MEQKIIFVYNADSSLEHQVFDFLHKAISPATYQCSLCAVTYGTFTIKKEWKEFIAQLPMPVEFLYRNEFRRYHPDFKTQYPAVLIQRPAGLFVLISAAEMKGLDLKGLMKQLGESVKRLHY